VAANWLGRDWVIRSGLAAGDQVIIDNLLKLRPGAPVAPHAPGTMPGPPPGGAKGDAGKSDAPKAQTDAAKKSG
jgi:membrane fusion protein (multidrug efflux system)